MIDGPSPDGGSTIEHTMDSVGKKKKRASFLILLFLYLKGH
jgi:hypothetical protein